MLKPVHALMYIYIYICELVVIDDYEPTWSIGLNVV